MRYDCEWDSDKARRNYQKHKIRFERAARVFYDPFAMSMFDEDHSDKEDRWITMGKDANGILLVVIHTFKEETQDFCRVRLISARKANRDETEQYERS